MCRRLRAIIWAKFVETIVFRVVYKLGSYDSTEPPIHIMFRVHFMFILIEESQFYRYQSDDFSCFWRENVMEFSVDLRFAQKQ